MDDCFRAQSQKPTVSAGNDLCHLDRPERRQPSRLDRRRHALNALERNAVRVASVRDLRVALHVDQLDRRLVRLRQRHVGRQLHHGGVGVVHHDRGLGALLFRSDQGVGEFAQALAVRVAQLGGVEAVDALRVEEPIVR